MTKKIFKRFTKKDVEDRLRDALGGYLPEIVSPIYSMIAIEGNENTIPVPERRDYFVAKRQYGDNRIDFDVCYSVLGIAHDFFEEHATFHTLNEAESFIEQNVRWMRFETIEEWFEDSSVSGILNWLLIKDGIDHIPVWARRNLMKFMYSALEDLDQELYSVVVNSLKMAYESNEE